MIQQSIDRLAKGKSLGGRKKTTVAQKLEKLPHNMEQIAILYSFGHTDEEVGQIIDVSEVTINNWKKDDQFALALKKGKEFSDNQVIRSLYKRALGFEYTEVKKESIQINVPGSENKIPATKITTTTKLIAADTTAQIFWLKNRKSDEWRNTYHVEDTRDTYARDFSNMMEATKDAPIGTKIRAFQAQLRAQNRR